MSKIIFLCWGFNGANSKNAIAICVNNIISKTRYKKNIIVITGGLEISHRKLIIDGVEVYNIPKINKQIKKELSNYKVNSLKLVDEILKEETINIVFAVSFQFINLIIGRKIVSKHKDIKLFVYELDPYAYNEALRIPILGFPYRYLQERRIFILAEKIFLTNELFKFYKTNRFNKFSNKFIELGIPMLEINDDYQVRESSNDCRIVFTGAFSKQYRDPSFMLKLFTLLKNKNNWSLHFYGVNIRDIDEYFLNELKGKLFIYDKLPRSEILDVIKDASILINIGNSMSNQLPSKLLDYIGFRKPIINIYKNEDDICNKYLLNYPIKLLIKENNNYLEKQSNNLLDFINENKNNLCSYSEIKKNYDKYTVETIVRKIDKYFSIN
jgi:hypothetical protein